MKLFIRFFSIGLFIAILWIALDALYVHLRADYIFSSFLDIFWHVFIYLPWLWGTSPLFKQYSKIKKYAFRLLTALCIWGITLLIYVILALSFHVKMGWSL